MADELAGAADDLQQKTGKRPATLAYPYGGVTEQIADLASDTYTLGLTTELRLLGAAERPMLLPRLDTYYLRDEGRLESWGTPALSRYLTLRAGLRRIRSTLTSIRP
jgi:peptidoglycan/xylan/chitin deacetylase (PgdA/CDA1 family)